MRNKFLYLGKNYVVIKEKQKASEKEENEARRTQIKMIYCRCCIQIFQLLVETFLFSKI